MPAETHSTFRRFFSIRDGQLIERKNGQDYFFNHISRVHLVDIKYRVAERNDNGVKVPIGDLLQLHLVDEAEYYVVEMWQNGPYAKSFYKTVENIALSEPLVLIPNMKVVDGVNHHSLFIKQGNNMLKWKYKKDDMGNCPPLVQKVVNGKTVWDDEEQMLFLMIQIEQVIVPALTRLPNPYRNHPVYRGNTGDEIAGNYFGNEQRVGMVRPVGTDEKNGFYSGNQQDIVDDLPF